jgi:hypothetical protein
MVLRALLTGCLALLLAAAPQGAGSQEPRFCNVEAIDGPEAYGWAAGEWGPLREGQAVAFESKVSTGPQTRVKIVCGTGIVVTVATKTEVNLGTLVDSSGDIVMQLIDGIVGLVAPEGRAGRFSVRTPLAIASVRSTEWLVEHAPADGSAVFVRAGRVAVAARAGGSATLGPGEGITIAPDGSAGEVKTWGEARIRRSTEALGFGWQ